MAVLAGAYLLVRGSLPELEGTRALPGLQASVTVTRDALGVVEIVGRSRLDVARATGFVHAQERFFQMDLMRRDASGELAALLGPAAVDRDRDRRRHRFRQVASEVIENEPPARRELLRAYAHGVNAGIEALPVRPAEYLLLDAVPEPWHGADSILIIFAMYLQLQDELGADEARTGALRDQLPAGLFQFLTQPGTSWDAPIVGEIPPAFPIPDAGVCDLRRAPSSVLAAGRAPELEEGIQAVGDEHAAGLGSPAAKPVLLKGVEVQDNVPDPDPYPGRAAPFRGEHAVGKILNGEM